MKTLVPAVFLLAAVSVTLPLAMLTGLVLSLRRLPAAGRIDGVDAAERTAGPEYGKPITIGSRVWMGGSSVVLPGVTIGNDTTIGAGSVVTRDIPDDVFAAGNPCRVLRELHE